MAYITADLLVTRTHSSPVNALSLSSESLISFAGGWLYIEGVGEVGSLHDTRALVSQSVHCENLNQSELKSYLRTYKVSYRGASNLIFDYSGDTPVLHCTPRKQAHQMIVIDRVAFIVP